MNVVDRGRLGPVDNGGKFGGVHANSKTAEDVSEELKLLLIPLALLWVGEETGLVTSLEYHLGVIRVPEWVAGEGEDVVQEHSADDVE